MTDSNKPTWMQRVGQAVLTLPPTAWLIGCGVLMALLYLFGFTLRYGLVQYGEKPLQTIALISSTSMESGAIYVVSFAALFGLYWIGLRRGTRPATRNSWMAVIGLAVVFNGILLLLYPVNAADVYDYIIRGRMSSLYGMNPMWNTPNDLPADPFYKFAAPGWHDTPSAYGPVWEMVAAGASRIAGDSPVANVIVFKLIPILAYFATAALIALTLRIVAPRRMLTGVYLFLWNPLVIYVTAGSGHNDALMAVCLALAFYCLARKWYVASTAAATLGALVKFMPALLVPIIILIVCRALGGWQARAKVLRFLVLTVLVNAALCILLYAPYWRGPETLGVERRTAMYTSTVATVARQLLGVPLDGKLGESYETPNANNVLRWLLLAMLGVFTIEQLDRAWRANLKDDPLVPVRILAVVLLFYLMVASTWFQGWYLVWVVPLAALLDDTPLRRLTLLYCYTATWKMVLYDYLTLRPEGWMPLPWRDMIPAIVVQVIPWVYVAQFWITLWLRGAIRNPLNVAAGNTLRTAREAAGISVHELADQLDWRTDDLIDYEQGRRGIPLDRAAQVGQVLNVPIGTFIKEF